MPERVIDLLFEWRNRLGKHSSKNIWNLTPFCLMSIILRERNNRTFMDEERSGNQLLASFVGTLCDWAQACGFTSSNSIPILNTLSSCKLIIFIFLFCNYFDDSMPFSQEVVHFQ